MVQPCAATHINGIVAIGSGRQLSLRSATVHQLGGAVCFVMFCTECFYVNKFMWKQIIQLISDFQLYM